MTLAQNPPQSSRGSNQLLSSLSLMSLVILLLTSLSSMATSEDYQRINLALPDLSPVNQAISADSKAQAQKLHEQRFVLQRNQSLSHALQGIADQGNLLWRISRHDNAHFFTQLRQGDELIMWLNEHNELVRMTLDRSATTRYVLEIDERLELGLGIHTEHQEIQTRIVMASGHINGSFYLAIDAVGASPKTIMNLADIFSWEVDFVRELREGDEFTLIYERRYINGEYIGDGAILAAQLELKHRQRTLNAFRFEQDDELLGYFNEKGNNLRKAFMRNPINYTRISSRFQKNRYHPVLKEVRDHKGVDYAAPTGTPIYAAGDGIVKFRGWGRGYGNYVTLQHAGRYETVYGHMSRFGQFRKGQAVKQGDIIGYVGMTGLATGPHLHYEFRINGVHHDPLSVQFPDAEPVPKTLQTDFAQWAGLLNSQLQRTDPEVTQLAKRFE